MERSMIRNTLPGLDFALGGDVDMLRETVGSFAQAKIAPRAEEAGARRARPSRHHRGRGMGRVVFADCEVAGRGGNGYIDDL
jgi:hypothetical protein